ncbi:MAG: alpha/beta fold hydrolase [Caulobacteraceae bacterium]|nr:alpha/beta fold hydrolase [Caulobacteraceae bacterium]
MSMLNRDGVELYYEVHGQGPALLLSHGYSATCQMWAGQVEALAKHFTLIVWDMRGHGRSDSPEDQSAYSEAATVADMAALLDAVGAGTAVLGGLSLGGYMSLAFHRAHRERVGGLMLFDTGPGYRADEAREGWNQRALRTAERFEAKGQRGLALAARGMLAQRDDAVIASLPAIAVPTLVVVGADDTPFLAASDYMAAKIPGARKVVIPDAGHEANIDQPEAFNAAVLGFLREAGLMGTLVAPGG